MSAIIAADKLGGGIDQQALDLVSEEVHRRKFIGGSDAAAIFGLSPWKTPLDVYLLKRGEMPTTGREADEDIIDLLETGKEMEPVIVNRLIRRFKVKVTKRSSREKPNRYVDPEHAFLACEIDYEWEVTPEIAARFGLPAEWIGSTQNGEVKKVHQFAGAQFGEAETEEVPVQYAAQAMHGLMITGRQICMFAVQVGDQLNVYWIRRDDETIKDLRAQEVAFWHSHVLAGVEPEPKNLPDVLNLFRRKAQPVEVDASVEVAALFDEMEEAKDRVKAGTARIEDLKFEIGKFMLGEDKIQRERKPRGGLGDVKPTPLAAGLANHILRWRGSDLLSINLQEQLRIDSDRIKRWHPKIAAECSKTVSFFVFRPVKE